MAEIERTKCTNNIIGIPAGDPAGIGPEIVVKALSDQGIYKLCRPLVYGDKYIFEEIRRVLSQNVTFNIVEKPGDGVYTHGIIDIIQPEGKAEEKTAFGKVSAAAGRASYRYIKAAAEAAMHREIAAVATTPINKEAIKAAGIDFIGHTEMLASISGTDDPLTMFQVRDLRIFFLTRHVSLRRACEMVTADRIEECIYKSDEALRKLGFTGRRHIAVAGLNPHNGEHGLFGDDEEREIVPAVERAKAKGIDVAGPVPADSVFHQALYGKYDAVISLYHDQGHIASKTLDFEKTISLTLGMPFLRTSVDHGTAFDIAGRGMASAVSMKEAIRLAAMYCGSYRA